MELRLLTEYQVRRVYREDLKASFPDDERKPLAMILRALRAGCYVCYGLFEGRSIRAYAFFGLHGDLYLLDYLGTFRAYRSRGYGSRLLQLLQEPLQEAGCVLAEVEDPADSEDPDERTLRSRRRDFYLRNGFVDTGVTADTFGVCYRLLELPKKAPHTQGEIRSRYLHYYESILPPAMFRENIHL